MPVIKSSSFDVDTEINNSKISTRDKYTIYQERCHVTRRLDGGHNHVE